jgi:hypothetical protein
MRKAAASRSELETLDEKTKLDRVHPLSMRPVGPALDALAHEAGALDHRQRPLVEAVDPDLEPVIAKLTEEHSRQLANRRRAQLAAAEVGMNREPDEVSDAAAPVRPLEADRPRHSPLLLERDLDQKPAEGFGLGQRALDLGEQLLSRVCPTCREEGSNIGLGLQSEQVVDVVRRSPPEPQFRLAHWGSVAGLRLGGPKAAACSGVAVESVRREAE